MSLWSKHYWKINMRNNFESYEEDVRLQNGNGQMTKFISFISTSSIFSNIGAVYI